jgi:hypothetical protein
MRKNILVYSMLATILLVGSLFSLAQATDDMPKEVTPIIPERNLPEPEDGTATIYDGQTTDANSTDLGEEIFTTQGNNILTDANTIELDSEAEATRANTQTESNSTITIIAGILALAIAVAAIGMVSYHKKLRHN